MSLLLYSLLPSKFASSPSLAYYERQLSTTGVPGVKSQLCDFGKQL